MATCQVVACDCCAVVKRFSGSFPRKPISLAFDALQRRYLLQMSRMPEKCGWCCRIENCGIGDQSTSDPLQVIQGGLGNEVVLSLAELRMMNRAAHGEKDDADQVRAQFSVRSVGSTSSSTGSGRASLNEEQKAREMMKLREMVQDFVREVLQGVFLDVVLDDGSLVTCHCCMDSKLTIISLQVNDIVRNICIEDIQDIYSGKELERLPTTTPLDDNCATLVMANDRCVSFKFKSVAAREHFATCMKVLRLASVADV